MTSFVIVCAYIIELSFQEPLIDNQDSTHNYLYLPDPVDGSLYVSDTHGLKVPSVYAVEVEYFIAFLNYFSNLLRLKLTLLNCFLSVFL